MRKALLLLGSLFIVFLGLFTAVHHFNAKNLKSEAISALNKLKTYPHVEDVSFSDVTTFGYPFKIGVKVKELRITYKYGELLAPFFEEYQQQVNSARIRVGIHLANNPFDLTKVDTNKLSNAKVIFESKGSVNLSSDLLGKNFQLALLSDYELIISNEGEEAKYYIKGDEYYNYGVNRSLYIDKLKKQKDFFNVVPEFTEGNESNYELLMNLFRNFRSFEVSTPDTVITSGDTKELIYTDADSNIKVSRDVLDENSHRYAFRYNVLDGKIQSGNFDIIKVVNLLVPGLMDVSGISGDFKTLAYYINNIGKINYDIDLEYIGIPLEKFDPAVVGSNAYPRGKVEFRLGSLKVNDNFMKSESHGYFNLSLKESGGPGALQINFVSNSKPTELYHGYASTMLYNDLYRWLSFMKEVYPDSDFPVDIEGLLTGDNLKNAVDKLMPKFHEHGAIDFNSDLDINIEKQTFKGKGLYGNNLFSIDFDCDVESEDKGYIHVNLFKYQQMVDLLVNYLRDVTGIVNSYGKLPNMIMLKPSFAQVTKDTLRQLANEEDSLAENLLFKFEFDKSENKMDLNDSPIFQKIMLIYGLMGQIEYQPKEDGENPSLDYQSSGLLQDGMKKDQQAETASEYYQLGLINYYGLLDNEKNYQKAFEWFNKASAKDHKLAFLMQGIMYLNGQYVGQDYGMAYQVFSSAALKENKYALNNLGLMYARGQVGKQDDEKALSLIQKAYDNGLNEAKFNLDTIKGLNKDRAYVVCTPHGHSILSDKYTKQTIRNMVKLSKKLKWKEANFLSQNERGAIPKNLRKFAKQEYNKVGIRIEAEDLAS